MITSTHPPHGPRNVLGARQFYAWGNRLKDDPRPESLRDVVDQRNYYRRALAAAVDGSEQMAFAAETCARMRMCDPEDAIRYCRQTIFCCRYDDLPLTQIERDMIRQGSAFVTLLAYRVVKRSIERELIAAREHTPAPRPGTGSSSIP